jgi:8-oxo-dGTP pyrophosphatase MutT (NUDIX family)
MGADELRLLKEIYRKDNLNLSGRTIYREAVRGIIRKGNKLLMVYSSKDGDYKFPGGGVNTGETYEEALMREIREECGAMVTCIRSEFGMVIEYAKPKEPEYDVFKMASRYYLCDIDPVLRDQILDDYEEKLGFKPVWIDIDSAIEANKKLIESERHDIPGWTRRELFVLELLKKEPV